MNHESIDGTLSTDAILLAAIRALGQLGIEKNPIHLDIGSGQGALISLMKSHFNAQSEACDYTAELMKLPGVNVHVTDLDKQEIPFNDHHFDVVTCTEVIEHLENPRSLMRQMFRLTRSGGHILISTPNVLNLKSRIRYLFFGFFNLFGPLHFRESRRYSAGGHITPISGFYLVHGLIDAGFTDVQIRIDKKQSSSTFWWFWLNPWIQFFSSIIRRKEVSKYQTIDESNRSWVKWMNSKEALLGRTILVTARKP